MTDSINCPCSCVCGPTLLSQLGVFWSHFLSQTFLKLSVFVLEHRSSGLKHAVDDYLANPPHRGVGCSNKKEKKQQKKTCCSPLSSNRLWRQKVFDESSRILEGRGWGVSVQRGVHMCVSVCVLDGYEVINQIPKKCGSKSSRIPAGLNMKWSVPPQPMGIGGFRGRAGPPFVSEQPEVMQSSDNRTFGN